MSYLGMYISLSFMCYIKLFFYTILSELTHFMCIHKSTQHW